MDLQCSKWHIGLKIEDFVFFTSILPKILPFLHLFELSYPIYGLHSTVWYCFICTTIFLVHLWIYSVPIGKLALKLTILYFFYFNLAHNLAPFAPFWASIYYLWITQCSFGIVSFAQPFYQSIYGFTVFQLENSP